MTDREIADIPRRFVAVLVSNRRVTVPKELAAAWQMQEGESWVFEIVRRVEVDA